jgi:hypothetical protein
VKIDILLAFVKQRGASLLSALVCSAWFTAACTTRQPTSPPSNAPWALPVRAFDDTLVHEVGPGCLYDRKPLPAAETSTSGTESSLMQRYTRVWTATLSWGEAAEARGSTMLTLAFADPLESA